MRAPNTLVQRRAAQWTVRCNRLFGCVARWVTLPIIDPCAGGVFQKTDDEQRPRDDQP